MMNCEECPYGEYDHYVEGSPCAVYTCNHTERYVCDKCQDKINCRECDDVDTCPMELQSLQKQEVR